VPHETAVPFSAQVLCTPDNHAPCHFLQSHIRKVHACLPVTCHLHFWQNDRDLLRATASYQLNPILMVCLFASECMMFKFCKFKPASDVGVDYFGRLGCGGFGCGRSIRVVHLRVEPGTPSM